MAVQDPTHWIPTYEPDPPDLTTFHGRLKFIPKAKEISQSQMARDLGVPIPTFATWMRGVVPVRPTQVELCELIEAKYGIPKEWLAFGAGGNMVACSVWFDVRNGWGNRSGLPDLQRASNN